MMGKAQRHVDAANARLPPGVEAKTHQFARYMALIVIHGHHAVIIPATQLAENRVRRLGAVRINAHLS